MALLSRAALAALVSTLLLALAATGAAGAGDVIGPGETLSHVAARHGLSVSALAAANGIADPDRVTAGRRLKVPGAAAPSSVSAPAGTYRVRAGDTLGAIAARLGTSADALARANGISDPTLLQVGQVLSVDGSSPTAPTTSAGAGQVTVRAGDTLGAIAARLGTSAEALARANGISDPTLLQIGQVLRTGGSSPVIATSASPGAGQVTVRAGDTLGAIAARLGTSAEALAAANGIADPDRIAVGAVISTIASAGAAAPASQVSSSSTGRVTVQRGETLDTIARRHGTSAAALAGLNRIANPNMISAGRTLIVPGTTGPAAPVAVGVGRAEIAVLLDQSSARHGVPPTLARAIAWQESGWTQSARSNVGAIGVMQLMPDTATWLGPSVLGRRIDPHAIGDNVDGGVAYLGWLRRQTGSDRLAVAAYYQGLTAVRRHGLYGETERYVASVFALVGRV